MDDEPLICVEEDERVAVEFPPMFVVVGSGSGPPPVFPLLKGACLTGLQ